MSHKILKDYLMELSNGGGDIMQLGIGNLNPIVSILFGVLILIFPKSLNYLIAAFLIISGLLALGIIK